MNEIERIRLVRQIAEEALEREPEARGAFLDAACKADDSLRPGVDRLLELAAEPALDMEPVDAVAQDSPDARDSAPASAEGALIGGFEISRLLGRGGMGEVHLARDVKLDRKVALKLLPFAAGDEDLARFEREARLLAKIDHPGIVKILSVGSANGRHFFTMEFVDGHDLAREISLARDGSKQEAALLPAHRSTEYVSSVVRIVADAADALQAAHDHGVVHRDIKPGNLLLDRDSGCVRLVDFGIARDLSSAGSTRSGMAPGTPSYMSPEQLRGEASKIDGRTDVFSLGVVLYELLTLRRPFDGENSRKAAEAVLSIEPSALDRVDSRIPRDLAIVCEKALSKRREDRYSTAREFGDDLRRFLRHEAIVARPPTVLRRTVATLRRHPKSFTAAVLASSIMIVVAHDAWSAQRQRTAAIETISDAMALPEWRGAGLNAVRAAVERAREFQGRESSLSGEEREAVNRFRDRIEAFTGSARRDADRYFEISEGSGELLATIAWRRDHALELVKDALYVDDSNNDLVAIAERLRKNGGFVVEAHDRSGDLVRAKLQIAEIDLPSGLPREFESPETPTGEPLDLAPGFYRVRVLFPGGEVVETDVAPGIDESDARVVLAPPPQGAPKDDMVEVPERTVEFHVKRNCPLFDHTIKMPPFLVDRHEVTNSEFAAFCAATGHAEPHYWKGRDRTGLDDHPVVGICWFDAVDYARWVNKRLPSHAEWETYSGSAEGREVPWDTGLSVAEAGAVLVGGGVLRTYDEDGQWEAYRRCVVAVTDRPKCASPSGLCHLFGNVAEYGAGPFVAAERDGTLVSFSELRPLYGSCFLDTPRSTSLRYHVWELAERENHQIQNGFRCVRSLRTAP